jgi:hypothetical protein
MTKGYCYFYGIYGSHIILLSAAALQHYGH